MKKNPHEILDTLSLYELSLAAGGSIDSLEHISNFLLCLIRKKNLSYISVWLFDAEEQSSQVNSRLIFSHPQEYVKSFKATLAQNTVQKLLGTGNQAPLTIKATDDLIPENLLPQGAIAYIPLGNLGVLKIYDKKRANAFSEEELAQIKPILDNFSQSFQACMAHQNYKNELNEQSHFATKLRSMIDATLDGFVIINSKGEITEWNHQAETIFGWTREEVMGRTLGSTIVPPVHREAHKQGMQRFLRTEKSNILSQRIEIIGCRKSGEIFPIELSIVPVETSNGYIFCGYVRDITVLKGEEKKRQELMEKLELVNHELSDFAHVVSHDLKAPLRAIKNLSDWISEDYEDKLGEEGQQQFELLKGRVDRMKDLINGILEYSQMGRLNSEEKIVDLGVELEELLQALDPPEHIQLTITGKMPHVFLNEVSIMQVFQNLISNAIKYIDKPLGKIEIGCREEEENMCFWVKDNGPGIAEQDQKRIFNIFETLGNTQNYESTGVGLAIVKKILSNYQGDIWLTSTMGAGSCFYFSLPNKRIVSQTEQSAQA